MIFLQNFDILFSMPDIISVVCHWNTRDTLIAEHKTSEWCLEYVSNTSCMKRFHWLLQAVQHGSRTTSAFCPWSLAFRLHICSFEKGSQIQSSMEVSPLISLTLLGTDYLGCQSNNTGQVQCKKSIFFSKFFIQKKIFRNLTGKKWNIHISDHFIGMENVSS